MTTFNFWKNNRLDEHYTLDVSGITDGFTESEQYRDFIDGLPLERALMIYISTELSSVYENKEFNDMYLAVRQELRNRGKY